MKMRLMLHAAIATTVMATAGWLMPPVTDVVPVSSTVVPAGTVVAAR